ncbi:hypothetical protein [Candidatus Amarolinea dominans]|uniref:hypothetical protein n=1 Tax=Candidatus Amarolinea dominans TaxID=3140696 RepID=UPI003136A003|nr:hypothetical protein [Anaerolineae bacterium]
MIVLALALLVACVALGIVAVGVMVVAFVLAPFVLIRQLRQSDSPISGRYHRAVPGAGPDHRCGHAAGPGGSAAWWARL